MRQHGNKGGTRGSYKPGISVRPILDEVACVQCDHVGLTPNGHCKKCFRRHHVALD